MPISDKELLFMDLIQPAWNRFAEQVLKLIEDEGLHAPQVFISYAWANTRYPGYAEEQDIQTWLLGLHGRLTSLGISVLFDIKTMTLGTNIDHFMQHSVNDCSVVLVIGTQTYKARSNENTNVKREVEHIKDKLAKNNSNCVMPILYRGEFHNALPDFGQILGTNCSDEFLYQKNLPVLIEGLFQLNQNVAYQLLKDNYWSALKSITDFGLSDQAVADFAIKNAQKARDTLRIQREVVHFMVECNAKGHPDYQAQLPGVQSPSIKLLSSLKETYSRHSHIHALFGEPMPLEGQYINVQMLYQITEIMQEQKKVEDVEKNSADQKEDNVNPPLDGIANTNKEEFKDNRITSVENIFSKKEPLAIEQLFIPAKDLLTDKQKNSEARPELPPNFILLQGRAGSGKTTFVHYVTREWAMGRLWQKYTWIFSLRFRDLHNQKPLKNHANEIWKLSDWIYEIHFALQMDKVMFDALWIWLIEPDIKDGKVLFILDGYDETPTDHFCKQALAVLINSDIPKILTSRPYGLSYLPKDRRELEIVGFIDKNIDKYVSLYFKDNTNKAKTIISGLQAVPSLWGSAHIPVTLNVICGILETKDDIANALANLNTMSGLYENMERSLLERAYRKIPGKEDEHARKLKALEKDEERKFKLVTEHYSTSRNYLAKLAFIAFSKKQLIMSQKDVNDVLQSFNVALKDLAQEIDELLELGLLKKIIDEDTRVDTHYEFLHLTFQEYYAGHHLLWSVQQGSMSLLEDFSKIKLDPRYQLVVWFVAGAIKDKNKYNLFMRALAAPQGGDMLGNVQLGLLVRCTEENWELAKQTGWSSAITKTLQKKIQRLWIRYKQGEINAKTPLPVWLQMIRISPRGYQDQPEKLDLFPNALSEATSIFSFEDDCIRLSEFIKWMSVFSPAILLALVKLLVSRDLSQTVYPALTNMGTAAATPQFLTTLAQMLMSSNNAQQFWAGTIIEIFGAAALTPVVTTAIITLLSNSQDESYYRGFRIIQELGERAATPYFMSTITKMLTDHTVTTPWGVISAIGELGPIAATPEILSDLTARVLTGRCYAAIESISKLGRVAATNAAVLAAFEKLLLGNNQETCCIALDGIGRLGALAVTPSILNALELLLTAHNGYARHTLVDTISMLGPVALTPEILIGFSQFLIGQDDDDDDIANDNLFYATQKALSKLGAAAATPYFIAALVKILEDTQDHEIQYRITVALTSLGTHAAQPNVLKVFAKLLMDGESPAYTVVRCLIRLGPAVITTEILNGLRSMLKHNNDQYQRVTYSEIINLGRLGPSAATAEFIALLIELLESENWRESDVAVNTLRALGEAAASADFLSALIKLLGHSSRYVRKNVIKVIGNLGPEAATSEMFKLLITLLKENDAYTHDTVIHTLIQLGATLNYHFQTALSDLLIESNKEMRYAVCKIISTLGTAARAPAIVKMLITLMGDSDTAVRKKALLAAGALGASVVTRETIATITKILTDSNIEMRYAALEIIGDLGAGIATPEVLTIVAKSLLDKDEWVRHTAILTLCKLGSAAASNEILANLAPLLLSVKMGKLASQAIGELGASAATSEILLALIKLLVNNNAAAASHLTHLAGAYLCRRNTLIFPDTTIFPALATAVIVGAYLSGNVSFSMAHEDPAYYLRGYADKNYFSIPVTHAQAQWFICWSPQIINSIDENTLSKRFAEIERAGMMTSTQKTQAWFDAGSSSRSNNEKKAYGLVDSAVLTEIEETNDQCFVM